MELNECVEGLNVYIEPSKLGRKSISLHGVITGFCNGDYKGYVYVKRRGAKKHQPIHPNRLRALGMPTIGICPDAALQKGLKPC